MLDPYATVEFGAAPTASANRSGAGHATRESVVGVQVLLRCRSVGPLNAAAASTAAGTAHREVLEDTRGYLGNHFSTVGRGTQHGDSAVHGDVDNKNSNNNAPCNNRSTVHLQHGPVFSILHDFHTAHLRVELDRILITDTSEQASTTIAPSSNAETSSPPRWSSFGDPDEETKILRRRDGGAGDVNIQVVTPPLTSDVSTRAGPVVLPMTDVEYVDVTGDNAIILPFQGKGNTAGEAARSSSSSATGLLNNATASSGTTAVVIIIHCFGNIQRARSIGTLLRGRAEQQQRYALQQKHRQSMFDSASYFRGGGGSSSGDKDNNINNINMSLRANENNYMDYYGGKSQPHTTSSQVIDVPLDAARSGAMGPERRLRQASNMFAALAAGLQQQQQQQSILSQPPGSYSSASQSSPQYPSTSSYHPEIGAEYSSDAALSAAWALQPHQQQQQQHGGAGGADESSGGPPPPTARSLLAFPYPSYPSLRGGPAGEQYASPSSPYRHLSTIRAESHQQRAALEQERDEAQLREQRMAAKAQLLEGRLEHVETQLTALRILQQSTLMGGGGGMGTTIGGGGITSGNRSRGVSMRGAAGPPQHLSSPLGGRGGDEDHAHAFSSNYFTAGGRLLPFDAILQPTISAKALLQPTVLFPLSQQQQQHTQPLQAGGVGVPTTHAERMAAIDVLFDRGVAAAAMATSLCDAPTGKVRGQMAAMGLGLESPMGAPSPPPADSAAGADNSSSAGALTRSASRSRSSYHHHGAYTHFRTGSSGGSGGPLSDASPSHLSPLSGGGASSSHLIRRKSRTFTNTDAFVSGSDNNAAPNEGTVAVNAAAAPSLSNQSPPPPPQGKKVPPPPPPRRGAPPPAVVVDVSAAPPNPSTGKAFNAAVLQSPPLVAAADTNTAVPAVPPPPGKAPPPPPPPAAKKAPPPPPPPKSTPSVPAAPAPAIVVEATPPAGVPVVVFDIPSGLPAPPSGKAPPPRKAPPKAPPPAG